MRTQRPWVATLRSVGITAIVLLPALPEIARAAGVETVPFVASTLAVAAAVTRVLAVPAVAQFIDKLTRPETPPDDLPQIGRHRKDDQPQ